MTIEAVWDDRGQGKWKYKIPGLAGYVTSDRMRTSILSATPVLIREVKDIAFAAGVKLPDRWELSVRR